MESSRNDAESECESESELSQAIAQGQLETVLSLLAQGADLGETCKPPTPDHGDPTTPLTLACRSGSVEMVDYLLREHGFSFDGDSDAGDTLRRHCVEECLATGSVAFCRHVFGLLRVVACANDGRSIHSTYESGVLCEALADNTTVERLDLTGLGWHDEMLPQLAAMLATNRHLATLDMSYGNSFEIDAIERFVADVSSHNRSLLTLQIDLVSLDYPHTTDRVGELYLALDRLSVRALAHRRSVAQTSVHMLIAGRVLLAPCVPTTSSMHGVTSLLSLPAELIEAIVAGVDSDGVLAGEERKRVIAFARDLNCTRGPRTRAHFLRACIVSLTYWPDDNRNLTIGKKRKVEIDERAVARMKAFAHLLQARKRFCWLD